MAEFKEVMRQYHRMCNYYYNDGTHHCYDCPLGKNENLACEPGDENNIGKCEEWEDVVMEWSEKHQPITLRNLCDYITARMPSNSQQQFQNLLLLDKEIPEELVEKFNLRVIKGEN